MEQSGGPNFGRYRLLRRLGQGGMAEVYLAEVAGLGQFRKRIAIKRLLPHYAANERFVTMLRDEANIAAAIRHPHVAAVLDFGEVDGQHYIAMEYIQGVDLASVLRTLREREQLMPIAASVYVAQCVAEGLEAAHTLRDPTGRPMAVIHRDVSPHNILISVEGAVKLIDFGVAKAEINSTKTRSGVIKGKLQYMSPEQAQAHEVDGRSDVFSLGMTLYKVLTGRLPFTGRNEYQIYDQILRKEPLPPRAFVPELPERIDAVVMRALRKDPDRRFQSAGEMARVLKLALWDLDAEYGPTELAALLQHISPDDGQAAPEDDDFGTEDSGPMPVQVAHLPEEDIDRLTRVGTSVPERPELIETQAISVHTDPVSEEARSLSRGEDSAVSGAVPWPDSGVQTFHGAVTQIHDTSAPHGAVTRRHELPPITAVTSASVETQPAVDRRPRHRWLLVSILGVSGLGGAVVYLAMEPPERDRRRDATVARVILPDAGRDRPDAHPIAEVHIVADALPPPPDRGRPPPPPPDAGLSPVDAAPRPIEDTPPPVEDTAPATTGRLQRGYLTVNALPWANIEIDGRRLKERTPLQRHPLPAGPHLIRLIAPDGTSWSRRVVIKPGREAALGHKF